MCMGASVEVRQNVRAPQARVIGGYEPPYMMVRN